MYPHICHVFIDGGYLRAQARSWSLGHLNPRHLAKGLVDSTRVQTWAFDPTRHPNVFLGRITFFDGLPDGDEPGGLQPYWDAIELLDDVHLGFGALKGLKSRVRQKGVDALLAVDMLDGAFSSIYDVAVLVAGDADFVPVVEAVRRRGVMVVVAAARESLAEELRRAADRFIEIEKASKWLKEMKM